MLALASWIDHATFRWYDGHMATGKPKYVNTMQGMKILGIRGKNTMRAMVQRGVIEYAPKHLWPSPRHALYVRESLEEYLRHKSTKGRKPLSYEASLLPVDQRAEYERRRKANDAIWGAPHMYPPPAPKKLKLEPRVRAQVNPTLLTEVLKERGLM